MKITYTIIITIISWFIYPTFDTDNIYIVCRSTKSKEQIIADDFNLKDSLSTHIGIGYYENNELKIYNVSNVKVTKNNSSLICDDLNSFREVSDIHYISIWKMKVNKKEMKKFKKIISFYDSKIIHFDNDFMLNNGNDLYCSEFVYTILRKIDSSKFKNFPIKKKLDSFYSVALQRETLEYIPVDFFQTDKTINKIYEQKY